MLADPADGVCRSCGNQLQITDADDVSMTVVCATCGDAFAVEPDTFNDGCVTYYIPFMASLEQEGD